jgi:hypothetical protein
MKGYNEARAVSKEQWESLRTPEIVLPTLVCIAVRRMLKRTTTTIVRYPTPNNGWHYQLETKLL